MRHEFCTSEMSQSFLMHLHNWQQHAQHFESEAESPRRVIQIEELKAGIEVFVCVNK
jgi:hypothetical protein